MTRADGIRLLPHTVATESGIQAGLLVRTGSGRELGYVWAVLSVWHWRTASGANHGTRCSQRAAVDVLVDASNLGTTARTQPGLFARAEVRIAPATRATWTPSTRATQAPAAPKRVSTPAADTPAAPVQFDTARMIAQMRKTFGDRS